MQVIGSIASVAAGELARIYRFEGAERAHVIRCFQEGIGATFSFFARSVSIPESILRVTIAGPVSSQTRDCYLNVRWQRFEIAMKNNISLQPLDVVFLNQLAERVDVAIAFPQLEEGLFATSPIPPDVELPAIADKPGPKGATRAADRCWLDEAKSGLVIDSQSATTVFVGIPIPRADQLLETDFLSCLSFWSEEEKLEISVGISGCHHGKFVVRIRGAEVEDFVTTNIIAGNQAYFVCVIFDRNEISVIVNAAIALMTSLTKAVLFDRTYIGCAHGESANAFNGVITHYVQYATPLLYPRVLELYGQLCPDNPRHTYDYMRRYFRYALTTVSEIATLDACMEDEGFSYFLSQLQFALPKIYDQFAPGKAFKEEDVRE